MTRSRLGRRVLVLAVAFGACSTLLDGHLPVAVLATGAVAAGGLIGGIGRSAVHARARRRDRPYRDLFDRVSAGLYRSTPDGRFLQANPAFREMLAIPAGRDIRSVSVEELYVGFETRGELLSRVDAFDGMTTHEMQVRRADGVLIWVRDRTRPVYAADGSVSYYDGDLQDITEQRRAEAELRAQVRSKSELIAAVSHELRTPLTAILGFLDLVAGKGSVTSGERIEAVNIALAQAQDMALLVEDLLTAARIENRELVVASDPVDLATTIVPIATNIAPDAEVTVDRGLGGAVEADPARVRQILRNLITNAVRHGLPPVGVHASVDRHEARIVVTDRGPGVPVGEEGRIFDAFFSGSDARTRHGSIGIGLAVSRRLARLMGGDLTYERVDGETRFVLRLRAVAATTEAA